MPAPDSHKERAAQRTVSHKEQEKRTVPIATLADIEALERAPFTQHQPTGSVFQLLSDAADRHGDRPALRFLATGRTEEPVRDISFRDVKHQTIQAANFFRSLGVEAH